MAGMACTTCSSGGVATDGTTGAALDSVDSDADGSTGGIDGAIGSAGIAARGGSIAGRGSLGVFDEIGGIGIVSVVDHEGIDVACSDGECGTFSSDGGAEI